MNLLTQAVLDGNVAAVRHILAATPEATTEFSPSGCSMFELARHTGCTALVVALLYRHAPGAESFRDYAELLTEYVREVSNECWLAGWQQRHRVHRLEPRGR